jgi:SpoIID/LytB domain protein
MANRSTVLRGSTILFFHPARRRTIHPASAKRWFFLGLLTIALVLVVAPAAAADDENVEFEGAGWGHGVGMSQWGAFAQASGYQTAPRTYQQILSYYYTGTSIEQYDAASTGHGDLWVNLEFDRTDLMLRVLKTSTAEQVPATVTRAAETIDLTSNQSAHVVWASANSCTVEFREGKGLATAPYATWETGPCDIDIVWDGDAEGTPTTLVEIVGCSLFDWDAGREKACHYARGSLHILDNSGHDARFSGFDLILDIDIDDYTLGISEVSYSWPTEALKAQAVAARSYAAEAMDRITPLSRGCACDVYDTARSQRYVGWGHGTTKWINAVGATDNQVLTHPSASKNDVISAVYTSSNGGASESQNERWGGVVKPWAVSVDDPFSLIPNNPNSSWTKTISASSLAAKVWGNGAPPLTSVTVVARNTSGSAKTVEFYSASDDRTTTRSAAWVTANVGLKSWYFDVDHHFGPAPPPEDGFTDIGESIHRDDIEYLTGLGIALSCADGPNLYCPDDPMQRQDIAAFLARALDLPAAETDFFVDDNGLPAEADINRIAAVGITKGCNPPANDRFCPGDTVTRGQMAAFLVRAWQLTDPGPGDWFTDDDGSVFENDIDRLATAGMTKGCNPPANDRFCPTRKVTRAETASFIARALRDLSP